MEQICALPKKGLAISDTCRPMYAHFSVMTLRSICNNIDLPREPHSPSHDNTSDVWACSIQMLDIWKEVRDYVAECAEGRNESPWSPTSSYIRICSRLNDIECNLPARYRYKNAKFPEKSKNDIQQDKLFWLQWMNMQMIYHTIHAVLNHPFLYAQRASTHKRGPNMFWKNSSELALLHSVWITRLTNLAHEQGLVISDPQVGHCAAIAATLHLYHSRTANEDFNKVARTNFETCQSFVKQQGEYWPFSHQLDENLDRLTQQSFLREQETTRIKLSLNTSLMWTIIGYNPPSSYRSTQGLFHRTVFRAVAPSIEDDTALRPATYHGQAIELCRPDRNVATSPTGSQDGNEHNETNSNHEDFETSRYQNEGPSDLLLMDTNEYHTLIDTNFNQFSHNFDLDGADFGEWHFGTL